MNPSPVRPRSALPRYRTVAAVLAGGALLAACSSTSAPSDKTPTSPAAVTSSSATVAVPTPSASSAAFTVRSAAQWAATVPGCVGVQTVPLDQVGTAAQVLIGENATVAAASSTATCTIEGSTLLFVAFGTSAAEIQTVTKLKSVVHWLAVAPGWLVLSGDADSAQQARAEVQGIAVLMGPGASLVPGQGTGLTG